jgi:hypothetical protein
MKITRSTETLAGTTVIAEQDAYCLTLYRVGNCLSDSISEIIIDLPEYDIDKITDEEVTKMYDIAKKQYDDMRAILNSDGI